MVLRRARRNNAPFLGCSGYPTCDGLVAYDDLVDTLTQMVKGLSERVLVYERRAMLRIVQRKPEPAPPDPAA